MITANLLNLRGRVERVSTITINGETKSLHLKDRQLYRISSTDSRFSFNILDVHNMETFELSKGWINQANIVLLSFMSLFFLQLKKS